MNTILEATHLSGCRYAVRPQGGLGTCGWLSDGTPWQVEYVWASSPEDAVRKVESARRTKK